MVFIASETLQSRSRTCDSLTRIIKPVVGLGAVGMNSLNSFSPVFLSMTTPVTKATDQTPERKCSTYNAL